MQSFFMRFRHFGLLLVLIALMTGCSQAPTTPVTQMPLPDTARQTQPVKRKEHRGQLLYVPCYSEVHLDQERRFRLAITLSIRNTSLTDTLVVKEVAYYDTAGKLVKQFADSEIEVGPLATVDFFVPEEDRTGGTGANFLVRWASESPITDPVVEAVMVSTAGANGVSFVRPAYVLEQTIGPAPTSTPRRE